jgi:hypothetical protein
MGRCLRSGASDADGMSQNSVRRLTDRGAPWVGGSQNPHFWQRRPEVGHPTSLAETMGGQHPDPVLAKTKDGSPPQNSVLMYVIEKNFGRQGDEGKGERISTGGECSVSLD